MPSALPAAPRPSGLDATAGGAPRAMTTVEQMYLEQQRMRDLATQVASLAARQPSAPALPLSGVTGAGARMPSTVAVPGGANAAEQAAQLQAMQAQRVSEATQAQA